MKNNKKYIVYEHIFPNGMVYVGLTSNDPEKRWGKNGCRYKNKKFYDDIKNYVWENIEHKIIKSNLTVDEAIRIEKELILKYKENGVSYNISNGGELGLEDIAMFTYKGKTYTAKELIKFSKVSGLTAHDITTRVNHHGWSIEEALTKPKMKKDYMYEYNGNMYFIKDLIQFSKVKDLTIKDLYNRLNHHGWDVERALSQPLGTKKQPHGTGERKYEYKGNTYNSYELWEMRKVNELSVFDITNRINHHGWDIEKALTKPKKKMNQKFKYKNKLYTSKELQQIAKENGIDITYHDITDRINKGGWSVEKAVTTPKKKK